MERLRANPSLRTGVIAGGAFVLLLLITQFLLPGDNQGNGTPIAIMFSGLVFGLLNALTAVGIVIVFRSTRVINFSATAMGAAGGEMTFQLLIQHPGVTFWVAFPVGVLTAALAGLLFDLALGRRFFKAPRLVLTIATIAAAGVFAGPVRSGLYRLPIFNADDLTFEEAAGLVALRDRLPFRDFAFTLGNLKIPYGFAEIAAIVLAVATIVGVVLYFRIAKSGVAVRAMAENTERASLLGISTLNLSSIVWVIAGIVSGVGIILTGILTNPSAAQGIAPSILLPGFAAAVLARMRSIPVAALAAVGIQLFTVAWNHSFVDDGQLVSLILFLVIAGGMLLQRKTLQRSEESGGVSWEAAEEQRAIPRELLAVGGIRAARWAMVAIGLIALGLLPFIASTRTVVLAGVIALNAIVGLSILVLTGWAGQVSLGQVAFAGIGGIIGASLTSTAGLSFWLAVPITAALVAGFAVLIGIPALRIKGLFLLVSTFAFAIAVSAVLFNDRYFGWAIPDSVERPTLFLFDFEDERSMYFLCVGALIIATVGVLNLRRSRPGRILIAVRENDANLQSFGVSAFKAKLTAFAVSGALAGFSGAIFVHLQRGISADSFLPQRSVDLFLYAVVGGITSIGGVVMGTATFATLTFFMGSNIIVQVFGAPMLTLLLLYAEPGGLIAIFNRARDSILRIVAQRRQLIVPSLFADIDPDALRSRLIPLSPPIAGGGLEALGPEGRFALASELYAGRGVRFMDKMKPKKKSAEASLLEAAASAAEEAEEVMA